MAPLGFNGNPDHADAPGGASTSASPVLQQTQLRILELSKASEAGIEAMSLVREWPHSALTNAIKNWISSR